MPSLTITPRAYTDILEARQHLRGMDQAMSLLDSISELIRWVQAQPAAMARLYADPALDEACLAAGAVAMNQPLEIPVTSARQIFVATEIYTAGGHTRLLEDILNARPEEAVLLLTKSTRDSHPTVQAAVDAWRKRGISVCEPPDSGTEARLRWLLGWLAAPSVNTVWLACHGDDSVAVAACQARPGQKCYFIHHMDHTLALGVHLPHAIHLDVSPFSFHQCRANGVANVRMLPLTVLDEHSVDASLRQPFQKITATCGSPGKFIRPYAWTLPDVIVDLFLGGVHTHYHIGPMPDELLEQMKSKLAAAGIARDSLVHIPHVDSLQGWLKDSQVTLYLQSFPLCGYKAGVEAMAAGKPILYLEHYGREQLSGRDMLYPQALSWRTPEALRQRIQNFTEETHAQHSAWSRQHFEIAHHPALFARCLEHSFEGPGYLEPPPLQSAELWPVQAFLDDFMSWHDRETKMETSLAREISKKSKLREERDQLRQERDAMKSELRELKNSRWLRWGRKLGLLPKPPTS